MPYHGVRPEDCEGYGGETIFEDVKKSFSLTAEKLISGYDLTMVTVLSLQFAWHV